MPPKNMGLRRKYSSICFSSAFSTSAVDFANALPVGRRLPERLSADFERFPDVTATLTTMAFDHSGLQIDP
jgi:hypothetical protein